MVKITDLREVVYSAGKVFDGLQAGRGEVDRFLLTGSEDDVRLRADLPLLEDLRDAAQFILKEARAPIDTRFVQAVNAQMSRSGALHPGKLRTGDQFIGVTTARGRYTPDPIDHDQLQQLLARATAAADVSENAISIFVELAKAQPFEDGNKRTAVFTANALLVAAESGFALTIPIDDDNSAVENEFNDLLGEAYVMGESAGLRDLLHRVGLVEIDSRNSVQRRF